MAEITWTWPAEGSRRCMMHGVADVEPRVDFQDMFREHFVAVSRTVLLIVRDPGRAEEITQDAFLQLLRRWRSVSTYERPEAWVRRVAIRLAVRSARREERRDALIARWRVRPVDEPTTHTDVALAVATLPPMQRAAVVLYYWEDRSVAEVAALLDVSESTVKQHLFRARGRLSELLRSEVTDAG